MDNPKYAPLRIQPAVNGTQLHFDFNGRTRIINNYPGATEVIGMMLELDDRIKAIEGAVNVLDERIKR